MSSLNVLLVTYSFPPAGGVGVLRAASLARYFPSLGIRLDVLTTQNASAVGTDSALLKQIPRDVTIHRTFTPDLPFGLKKSIKKLITAKKPMATSAGSKAAGRPNLLKRTIQDILLPDPQVTWMPVLTRAAFHTVRKRQIDLVLITVPPFSSVLLAEKLHRKFPHLAIVLDFRDEWLSSTIDLVSFSRSKRALEMAHRTEAEAVKSATAVVAVTEAARRQIRNRYPQEPENKFCLIPNGFEAQPEQNPAASIPTQSDRKIVVSYVGSVYGSTEPSTLVEALRSLPDEIKSRFQLRFIGYIEEPRYRESLLQLGETVELRGFVPFHEALAAMRESDYALVISHDPLNVSAKFYDYLGAGKPILACVHPDGDIRRMLEDLRAGWWADSRDAAAIRQLFIDAAGRGESLMSEFHPDAEKIAQYERKPLAQRYAALLYSIAGQTPEAGTQPAAHEVTQQ